MVKYAVAALAIVVAVAAIQHFTRPAPPPAATASGAPASARATAATNDKVILVRGWNHDELDTIVGDFAKLYHVPPGYLIGEQPGGALFITFPRDIEAELFCYLVNYLNYPRNFDLSGRRLMVLGKTTLTSSFDVPDRSLVGRAARIYVPADDRDFDRVYVAIEDGPTYEHAFAEPQWQVAAAPRVPAALAGSH